MTTATKPPEWDWEELKAGGWTPTDCLFGCADPIPAKEDDEGIGLLPSTRDDHDCHWCRSLGQPYHVRCFRREEETQEGSLPSIARLDTMKRLYAVICRLEADIERLEDLHFFREEDLDEDGQCWFSNEQPTATVLRYVQAWLTDNRYGLSRRPFEDLALQIRERLAEIRKAEPVPGRKAHSGIRGSSPA